jgi:hypothetical protein
MKKALRILTLVYYTNYISALLSALIGYYFLRNNIKIDAQSEIGIIISTILIILIIGSVPLTLSIFNRYTKKIATIEDIETRIAKYQAAGIVRIQIMGFGLVLGVLFFYLMGSQSMLFCGGIAAIGLFFCKPTQAKISSELQIDED